MIYPLSGIQRDLSYEELFGFKHKALLFHPAVVDALFWDLLAQLLTIEIKFSLTVFAAQVLCKESKLHLITVYFL